MKRGELLIFYCIPDSTKMGFGLTECGLQVAFDTIK